MRFTKSILAISLLTTLAACSRVETGQVAIIRGFDKQVSMTEELPGKLNETIFQDVIDVQTKDISVDIKDLRPLAGDNSTLDDFDMTVIYSVTPQMAAELYVNKSSSFHAVSKEGDMILMYNYVYQLARNAAYKATREHKSLEMNDRRTDIEAKIIQVMNQELNEEKDLQGSVIVSQVLVRQITPAASIVQSANDFIRAQNEFKKKEVEVKTAEEEAKRIQALSKNTQAIEYMNAQANMLIAEGVASGKVQTIVVPFDFKGMVNVK